MKYKHDMSKESDPKNPHFEDGWHDFEVGNVIEQISKQGNEMFKITLMECELLQEIEVYAIAVQGKRWFLKQLLSATGIAAGQDGVYEWDIPDLIGKIVSGRVENEDEEWIDRQGKKRITQKSKVVEFQKSERLDSGASKVPF